MEQALTVTFKNATPETGTLQIEQEEWVETTGYVTKANLYNILYNQLIGQSIAGIVDCGLESDGSLSSKIYVYPSPTDLNYSLHTSYGNLSSKFSESVFQTESFSFNVSTEATLSRDDPYHISYTWEGVVRDGDGALINPPEVTVNGNVLTLSKAVYGTLLVKYFIKRHMYILSATARVKDGNVTKDTFGAVIYGIYSGGISWIELTPPPYAPEIASGQTCGGVCKSDDQKGNTDDYVPPQYAPRITRVYTYDYCSNDLTNFTEEQEPVENDVL